MLESIKWQPMCCAEHSAYAEARTRDGGVARLKRAADGIHVMRFDASNRRVDDDYVLMSDEEVMELLS